MTGPFFLPLQRLFGFLRYFRSHRKNFFAQKKRGDGVPPIASLRKVAAPSPSEKRGEERIFLPRAACFPWPRRSKQSISNFPENPKNGGKFGCCVGAAGLTGNYRNQRITKLEGQGLFGVVFQLCGVFILLDGLDFFYSSAVSSAGKIGVQPDLDHFAKQYLA